MSSLYYFAYGSNLHPVRFRRRVPSARVVTTAILPGYTLSFEKHGADDSGKCNITLDANEAVQGVVYQIAAAERPSLDTLEGGYDCRQLVVNTVKGCMEIYVYVARNDMIQPGLAPYHWYKLYVLHGARQQGLDANYCGRIEAQYSVDDPDTERQREHFRILGIE